MSVNKVILLGRLGQDPVLKYTASGAGVVNFSLATSEAWTDKQTGQRNEKTEWHRIVIWGKSAETASKYLSKGREVFLEGRLQTRSWEDKEGNKRYTTEVVANGFQFVGPKQDSVRTEHDQGFDQTATQEGTTNAAPSMMDQSYQASTNESFTADDIPF